MDLISIIVPIFNAEKFIARCVNSVLAQTYANWELILINDGSSDRSLNVCYETASLDQRIRVLSHGNKGVTATRKEGWKYAVGKWIVFVDADDTITSDCLEVLMSNANSENFDIVNAAFVSVGGSNRRWEHKTVGKMNRYQYLESFILNGTYGTVYASIYKKDLFRNSTFDIDASIKIGEDVLQNIEIGQRANNVLNINKVVYNYYDNDESVMNQKIMHPSYIERFYDIGDRMLRKEDGLMHNLGEVRDRQKLNSILNAYYSPYLPYDAKYKSNLYGHIKSRGFDDFNGRNKLYFVFTKLRLPLLLKRLLRGLYVCKKYLAGSKIVRKQILK